MTCITFEFIIKRLNYLQEILTSTKRRITNAKCETAKFKKIMSTKVNWSGNIHLANSPSLLAKSSWKVEN